MRVKHPKLSSRDSAKLVLKILKMDKNQDEVEFIDEDGIKHIYTNKLKK
jgi:hypothetical protein